MRDAAVVDRLAAAGDAIPPVDRAGISGSRGGGNSRRVSDGGLDDAAQLCHFADGGLASAWILTTGVAWAAIVRGRVGLHKEWMIRSYLVAFAFVTFRFMTDLLPGVTAKPGSNDGEVSTSIGSLCWVLPLAVHEVILQGRRLFGAGTKA